MTLPLNQNATGVLSGTLTPGDAAAGPYAVEVTTTSTGIMGSSSTAQDFTWTVTPVVDVPPTLTDPGDQTSVAGTAVSLAPTETDVDGTYPTYSATGLPDGLNIDPDFGVISGTPAEDAIQSGPYVVAVTMDDGDGGSTTQTFDWTVADSTMTLQGDAISQQAGAGVDTFQVATFTDPDLNRQASDYAATINWGDGQTSQGEVDGGNGAYTVSGDHVYLHPGDWPIQITVTDPAGGTATAATTASVTPAPLTATGNLQDGATSGLMSTFTVATFSDANGYLAAGDFTATITWGDGSSTTTGVIDGADGAFRVTGAHTYAYDGTYTVSVTVTDADGATATTTSQITAGDIQAGLDNTLTVASFTSADPNATAASFTAMIQWGDGGIMMGGTAGTVVQEGSQFVVLGAHAFQAAGVYTVQVTVTDLSGDQLTSSETVQAAPAPATGFGGDLAAQDGYVSDAALALFTLPQGYGALGQYTATADWGDGTSSAVSLVNEGGIWEALGDHGYSGPGLYAVKTLVYNAALQVVAAAVSLVEADAPAKIVGPAVVPGNSIYRYEVAVTPPTAADKIKKDFPSTDDGFSVSGGGSRVRSGFHQNSAGMVDYFWADIQFDNKPAVVHITLAKWLQGTSGSAATLPVDVVQVIVTNPPNAFSDPGNVVQAGTDHRNVTINGNTQMGTLVLGLKSGAAHAPMVAALAWQAQVTLTGPGPAGTEDVDHIAIGFHQDLTLTSERALFGATVLAANMEGNTYLDTNSAADTPWLSKSTNGLPLPGNQTSPPAYRVGPVGPSLIYYRDNPGVIIPVELNRDGGKLTADRVAALMEFQLCVAATTLDSHINTSDDTVTTDPLLWGEANAQWSVRYDGSFDGRRWQASTAMNAAAGVTAPAGQVWVTAVNAPAPLSTSGTRFNIATKAVTWRTL